MKKLYQYTGTVYSFSYRRSNPNALPFADLVLGDLNDSDKAPVKIEVMGGLADYLRAIEGTDAEERYIPCAWYYDDCLCLHRIEVPSTDPNRPAKIIAQHNAISVWCELFGPTDFITTDIPEPMNAEQRSAWASFLADDDYRA